MGELANPTGPRGHDAAAFTAAYGHYCWPVDGTAGLRVPTAIAACWLVAQAAPPP
ncbi:hypothetical protein [Nocardia brasiliensis]|uniref:hypothetical protein n=1 Tax=Nocardia brasiliensis TaxID=37326 RepID=UPI003D7A8B8B